MKKPVRRIFGIFAATVAILVILTTTALAAARYWSNFERLEEIIGSEQAGILQPVELGTATEANGFRAEIVAVGVFYNIVDIYLTLEDLTGDRLSGNMAGECSNNPDGWFLSYWVRTSEPHVHNGMEMPFGRTGMPTQVIDRCDNGVVTLHLRTEFDREITGKELTLTLNDISFSAFRNDDYHINLNLQALAASQPSVMHFDREQVIRMHQNATKWGKSDSYWPRGNFDDNFQGEGLYILEPHQHDIDLINVDGVDLRLSNLGFIDGRLHIQIYNPNPLSGPALITLRNADMEVIEAYMLLGFSLDDSGDLTWGVSYSEAIFEIDMDSLSEYQLYAFVSIIDTIDLSQHITLDVENFGHLAFGELSIDYNTDVVFNEVRINPLTVLVYGEFLDLRGMDGVTNHPDGRVIPDNPEYHMWITAFTANDFVYANAGRRIPRPEIRVHTTDGIIETAHFNFVRPGGSKFSLTFTIGGIVDLDAVVAVEVNGTKMYL